MIDSLFLVIVTHTATTLLSSSSPSQSEALKAVMEHDQRRSHMIETKLKEHKERLNDHESGRRRLKNVEEYEALQHKIVVFQRALDTLAKEGVNEKMEKLQDADYRDMRRIDYIDFGRTGI